MAIEGSKGLRSQQRTKRQREREARLWIRGGIISWRGNKDSGRHEDCVKGEKEESSVYVSPGVDVCLEEKADERRQTRHPFKDKRPVILSLPPILVPFLSSRSSSPPLAEWVPVSDPHSLCVGEN